MKVLRALTLGLSMIVLAGATSQNEQYLSNSTPLKEVAIDGVSYAVSCTHTVSEGSCLDYDSWDEPFKYTFQRRSGQATEQYDPFQIVVAESSEKTYTKVKYFSGQSCGQSLFIISSKPVVGTGKSCPDDLMELIDNAVGQVEYSYHLAHNSQE